MVLKFRVLSSEEDDFMREIEILPTQTFLEFHELIQESLEWDESQLASFFESNDEWEKGQEIALLPMGDDTVQTMEIEALKNHVYCSNQKYLYVFDYFNERLLYIELMEVTELKGNKNYPRCTKAAGVPPPQLTIDTEQDNKFEDYTNDDVFEDFEELPEDY